MKRRGRPARRPVYRRYAAAAVTHSLRPIPPPKRDLRQAEAYTLSRPRLVSGSIALTIVVLGIWIGFDDAFYVMAPTVSGHRRVPAHEAVSGSRMAGLHVLWVNSSEIEATLLRMVPSLREARVSCALPADCAIAVTEREPYLAWRWGQAAVWIDQAGVVFPARGDPSTGSPLGETTAHVPSVGDFTGQAVPDLLAVTSTDASLPSQHVDPKIMSAIRSAAQALPDVRAYRYTVARGLEFDDSNGYPVYLGVGSNMGEHAAVWRALRDDLASRSIQPAYLDVRFPLAPYYGR